MRFMRYFVGLALATFFIFLTFRDVDWDEMGRAFSGLSLGAIMLGLTALGIAYSLRIYRWLLMLRVYHPQLSFGLAAGPFLSSFALNNVLPFRAGDVIRAFAYKDRLGVSPPRVLGTLVLERILDLLALLGLLFVGVSFLPEDSLPAPVLTACRLALVLALTAAALFLMMPVSIGSLLLRLSRSRYVSSVSLLRKIIRFAVRVAFAVGRLRSPLLVFQLAALSILAWAFEGTLIWAVSAGINGTGNGFGPWLALSLGNLATLIPGTPGHVGTFDYFARMGLVAYGSPLELATVHVLVVHALLWLPITLLGGACLMIDFGVAALRSGFKTSIKGDLQ